MASLTGPPAVWRPSLRGSKVVGCGMRPGTITACAISLHPSRGFRGWIPSLRASPMKWLFALLLAALTFSEGPRLIQV